jgi:hypothetical protein
MLSIEPIVRGTDRGSLERTVTKLKRSESSPMPNSKAPFTGTMLMREKRIAEMILWVIDRRLMLLRQAERGFEAESLPV